jgi:hypothetical protein
MAVPHGCVVASLHHPVRRRLGDRERQRIANLVARFALVEQQRVVSAVVMDYLPVQTTRPRAA